MLYFSNCTLRREDSVLGKRILALAGIFLVATVAWAILGTTIFARTYHLDTRLRDSVGSTWGTPQEQLPPAASYRVVTSKEVKIEQYGKTTTRTEDTFQDVPLSLDASHIDVKLHLDHRQKGLLWYSTYVVDFAGDYKFRNPSTEQQKAQFRLTFPAQKAVYDGLAMQINGHDLPIVNDASGAFVETTVAPNETAALHLAYRSQGLESWRYKLGNEITQVRDFSLAMQTNFKDIDFADDTLSPTSKEPTSDGWSLQWRYSSLVSGFQIGMTMPEKLQPGPLAGEISYAAPVSLLFFFFLMFILSALRNIDLPPMNYFFLAAAFFSFHLLLAYLVDHISIHAAFVICSLVSVALVVSYLRLVAGIRFAAIEAGIAQLIYLVLFSYAFFWKGFTGLAITIGAILTLFVVMQVTGRIRWSEKFTRTVVAPPPAPPLSVRF
jgi:inner membrane protein involved in colicin E2 resistance